MAPRHLVAIKHLPGVQRLRAWRYDRYFEGPGYTSLRGIFSTFADARCSAPATKPLGFDVEGFVHKYADRPTRVFPHDYPVLLGMLPLIGPNTRVFDWGGHLAVHFRGYEKYLHYPPGLRWTICEVPRIVEVGTEDARRRNLTAVRYTMNPREADGCDILLAAGSLQYIDAPSIVELLTALRRPPPHLFLNKLPLYSGEPFVTLQNAGVSFVPLHIWNRDTFIRELSDIGYDVMDTWDVQDLHMSLPFHPERSFSSLTGLYLRAR